MSGLNKDKPTILVVGLGPFPAEMEDTLHLPGIRAWEIARELARAGHRVQLLGLYVNSDAIDEWRRFELDSSHPSVASMQERMRATQSASIKESELTSFLDQIIVEHSIRAAVGVMESVGRRLCRVASTIPIWMDLPGDPMAERQLLSVQWESDVRITEQWAEYVRALARADRISGCSRHQVGALCGELGAGGRLNRHTAFEPIMHHIPLGPIEYPEPEAGPILRGRDVPQNAFVVFQTGGFNNWLDEETLFRALEIAMERESTLHFVATGGSLGVHNNKTFERFRARVDASPNRSRFHLLGWMPLSRALGALLEADAGVVCDHPGIEGWLGDRYRLIHYVDQGIPVVCTIGCENAEALGAEGLVATAPQRAPAEFAECLLRIHADREAMKARARRAQDWLREKLKTTRRLAPIVEWCGEPKPGNDIDIWRKGLERPPELRNMMERLPEAAEMDALRAENANCVYEMSVIKGSRLVRMALWLRAWRKRIG